MIVLSMALALAVGHTPAAAQWAGAYTMTSALSGSTCEVPCPQGAIDIPFTVQAVGGGYVHLVVQPYEDLYWAYMCGQEDPGMVCHAQIPLEAPGYMVMIDSTIHVEGAAATGLTGDITDNYTYPTTGARCTCRYTLRAEPPTTE